MIIKKQNYKIYGGTYNGTSNIIQFINAVIMCLT